MNNLSTEKELIDTVRSELDKSCDRLDGHTLSRLNKIRHEAMEQNSQSRKTSFLLPFGGLVSACMVLLVVSFWSQHSSIGVEINTGSSTLEDLEILTAADNLDFYEDFEFYQWLAENESSV